jgi:hypothetical protein
MQCPFLRGGLPSIFNDMKANQVYSTCLSSIRLPINEFGSLAILLAMVDEISSRRSHYCATFSKWP